MQEVYDKAPGSQAQTTAETAAVAQRILFWSADILVQCRQELRLGLTRAKGVLGGSISPAGQFPLTP